MHLIMIDIAKLAEAIWQRKWEVSMAALAEELAQVIEVKKRALMDAQEEMQRLEAQVNRLMEGIPILEHALKVLTNGLPSDAEALPSSTGGENPFPPESRQYTLYAILAEAGTPLMIDEIIERYVARTGYEVPRSTVDNVLYAEARRGAFIQKVRPSVFAIVP